MNDMRHDDNNADLEERLISFANNFPYPPTPDLSQRILDQVGRKRRLRSRLRMQWAWGIAVILVFLAGLLAVPPVRAAVFEILQIGAIRILFIETPSSLDTDSPDVEETIIPTSALHPALVKVAGETTLDIARQLIDFPILLPRYPQDIGLPNKVYIQDLGAPALLLVWFEPGQEDVIRMSILMLSRGAFATKGLPASVENTTVAGVEALWVEGDHQLILEVGKNNYSDVQFFVQGNVLIWERGEITIRLEGEITLEEARKIAESMR